MNKSIALNWIVNSAVINNSPLQTDYVSKLCSQETRQGRHCWKQTFNRLASGICPILFYFILITCDTWHLTRDTGMWHMTGGERYTFSQNVSSLALTVWEWRFVEDISTNHQWMNQSVSQAVNGGDCRTAPAFNCSLVVSRKTISIIIPKQLRKQDL